MTQRSQVILICSTDALASAQRLAAEISSASAACGADPLSIDVAPADILPDDIECRAALLLLGTAVPDDDRSSWRDVVAHFEERTVPVLAITAPNDRDVLSWWPRGCLPVSSAASPAELAAHLLGLLHQQFVVERLNGDLQLAQRFQGGLRGEIARMHDEMQLAALVQQELLPRTMPNVCGMSFGALWRPANYVSGDIYDVTRLDEDHVGVFLADVVGHGVPAALLTMVLARALQTKEISGNSYRIIRPGEALSILNQEMLRIQGDTTRFATAVYAVINCRDRTARLAVAGHPPPLLLRNGEMTEIEASGGLLGVFDEECFDDAEVELHVDDRVLFYSDGFEVAFPEESEDNIKGRPSKRYLDEFSRLGEIEGGPQDMIFAIGSSLNDQPGSLHQVDDLTLVAVHAGALVPDPVTASAA